MDMDNNFLLAGPDATALVDRIEAVLRNRLNSGSCPLVAGL
jgi:hypothetical protein